jgi:hypothetical protein
MSKGGGSQRTITQTTAPSAFAEPFLQYGMQEAQDLYQSARPQYYPKSTVVGFSPETQMALSGYRSQAAAGSPMIPAVQQAVMQNLTGTNPLFQQALQPTIQQAMQGAMSSGRYGSGYAQKAVAEAVAPLMYQAQQQAIQQAPAARELGFADLQTMAQVGAAREAQEQAELAADIERFQFQEARPAQKLADYLTMVQGGSGALGGRTITPQFRNPALGFLSGGMAGAQAGSMMSGGGAVNPMYALGGALLGGLG